MEGVGRSVSRDPKSAIAKRSAGKISREGAPLVVATLSAVIGWWALAHQQPSSRGTVGSGPSLPSQSTEATCTLYRTVPQIAPTGLGEGLRRSMLDLDDALLPLFLSCCDSGG